MRRAPAVSCRRCGKEVGVGVGLGLGKGPVRSCCVRGLLLWMAARRGRDLQASRRLAAGAAAPPCGRFPMSRCGWQGCVVQGCHSLFKRCSESAGPCRGAKRAARDDWPETAWVEGASDPAPKTCGAHPAPLPLSPSAPAPLHRPSPLLASQLLPPPPLPQPGGPLFKFRSPLHPASGANARPRSPAMPYERLLKHKDDSAPGSHSPSGSSKWIQIALLLAALLATLALWTLASAPAGETGLGAAMHRAALDWSAMCTMRQLLGAGSSSPSALLAPRAAPCACK